MENTAEYTKEMTNQDTQVATKIRDLEGAMNEGASAFDENGGEISQSNQDDFGSGLNLASEDIESTGGELQTQIDRVIADAEKTRQKVFDTLDDSKEGDKEESGELTEEDGEVSSVNAEQASIPEDIKRGLGYSLAKVEKDAAKVKDRVIEQAAKTQAGAESDLQRMIKEVNILTREQLGEWLETAGESGEVSSVKSEELEE